MGDSHDGDISEDLEAEVEHFRQNIKKPKAVRFEDILDDSTPGEMETIRRKIREEDLLTKAKAKVTIMSRLMIVSRPPFVFQLHWPYFRIFTLHYHLMLNQKRHSTIS